jgi:hypothetical protein
LKIFRDVNQGKDIGLGEEAQGFHQQPLGAAESAQPFMDNGDFHELLTLKREIWMKGNMTAGDYNCYLDIQGKHWHDG